MNEGLTSKVPIIEQLSLIEKLAGSLALGWFLGLSCPGYGVWWTAWCAIAPLLVLLRSSRSWVEAAITGFAFGCAYNLFTSSWMFGFHPAGFNPLLSTILSWFILIVNACAVALPFAAFAVLSYALPMRAGFFPHYTRPYFPYILSIPLLWIFIEYIAGRITGLHLNDLACSQACHIQFIQIASLGGGQLVDFVLVLFNAALAQLFMFSGKLVLPLAQRTDRLSPAVGSIVDVLTVILIVVLCTLAGARQLLNPLGGSFNFNKNLPSVAVSVLQGDENYAVSTGTTVADPGRYPTYKSMAESTNSSLIVLPEGILDHRNNSFATFQKDIEHQVLSKKQEIISGTILQSDGVWISSANRLFHNDVVYVHVHPSHLFTLMKLPAQLMKVYTPLQRALYQDYLEQLPCATSQVIETKWGRLGISTGLASACPPMIADETQHGAGLLICLVDLSCFRSVILDKQVLASAVIRAIENGRYMILSTNRGISAIIDPCGRIIVKSLSCTRTTLTSPVQFIYRRTLFSKTRWL